MLGVVASGLMLKSTSSLDMEAAILNSLHDSATDLTESAIGECAAS